MNKAVAPIAVVLALLAFWPASGPVAVLGDRSEGSVAASPQAERLSRDEAVELAARHISRQAMSGAIPDWGDAQAGPALAYYDLQGGVAAYVVEVIRGEAQAGYVTVSAPRIPNPILEFGRSPAYHRLDPAGVAAVAESGVSIDREHPRYLGPLSYYHPAARGDTGEAWLVDMRTGEKRPASSRAVPGGLAASRGSSSPPLFPAPRGSEEIGAAGPATIGVRVARSLVLTAPKYVQFWYGRCNVGSAPTAAGMLLSYWVDKGYWNLIEGGTTGDYKRAIVKLHELMGTFCDGPTGVTEASAVTPALLSYAEERGYAFSSEWLKAPIYDQFVAEINSGRLVMVNVVDSRGDSRHPPYGDRTVAGIGFDYDPLDSNYRYMVIRDTGSINDRWLQYGVNYGSISFNTFVPPSAVGAPLPAPTASPSPEATPLPSDVPATSISEDGVRSLNPAVATDAAGNVHVVWVGRFPQKEEVFYRSWNGAAWSPTTNVSQNSGRSLAPAVAADPKGNVHVVWQDDTNGSLEILYRLWNGSEWSKTMNVTAGGMSLFPAVAVDPAGLVHLLWSNNTGIVYRRLLGSTMPDTRLAIGTGDSWDASVATGADGNVHVVWRYDTDESGAGILHRRWSSGGGWSPIDNLSSDNSNSSYAPSVAADAGGGVHVVWRESPTGNTRISYRRWVAGGGWSATENLSPGSEFPSDPVVATDATGNVHVVWHGNTAGNFEILHRIWNGTEWSLAENLSANSGSSRHPRIAVDPSGKMHGVWEDDTAGTEQVLHTTRPAPSAATSPTVTPTPTATPPTPAATATPVLGNVNKLTLASGWNLISIPKALANSSLSSIFSGVTTVDKVFVFSAGAWNAASFDGGAWDGVLTELKPGPAYWVKATTATTVTLNYKPADPSDAAPALLLEPGWNFIGYTSLSLSLTQPVDAYLKSLAGKWTALYKYDPVAGYDQAKPGLGFPNVELFRGYSIYVTEAGTLAP